MAENPLKKENRQKHYDSEFYRRLVRRRARREIMLGDGLINDRGFRHIKNLNDLSGVTYAFWLIRK